MVGLAGTARAQVSPGVEPAGRWTAGEPARLRLSGTLAEPGERLVVTVVAADRGERPARVLGESRSPDGSALATVLLPALLAGRGTVRASRGGASAVAPVRLDPAAPPGTVGGEAAPLGDGRVSVTVVVLAGERPTSAPPVEVFYVPSGETPLSGGDLWTAIPIGPDGTWTGTLPARPGASGVVARLPGTGVTGTVPLPATPVASPTTTGGTGETDGTTGDDTPREPARGDASGVAGDVTGGPLWLPGATDVDRDTTLAGGLGLRGALRHGLFVPGDLLEAGFRVGYASLLVERNETVTEEFTIVAGGEPYVITRTEDVRRVEEIPVVTMLLTMRYRWRLGEDGGSAPYVALGLGLADAPGEGGPVGASGFFACGLEVPVGPSTAATVEVSDTIFRETAVSRKTVNAFGLAVGLLFRF